jgi:uncharacterized membrane protein AbrB (regulator of aidB expression)
MIDGVRVAFLLGAVIAAVVLVLSVLVKIDVPRGPREVTESEEQDATV